MDYSSTFKKIKNETCPIYLLGAGGFAVDVLRFCQCNNINIEEIAVNEDVDNDNLMGYKIEHLDNILKKKERISVIAAFANYPKAIEIGEKYEGIKEVYCLTQAAYGFGTPISEKFITENKYIIDKMYDDCSDSVSYRVLKSYFDMRVNDSIYFGIDMLKKTEKYFKNSLFDLTENESLIDIGSYLGASIMEFVDNCDGKYDCIYGIEPDSNNYAQLVKNIESKNFNNVFLSDFCIWKEDGLVKFKPDGDLGGIDYTNENSINVCARSIDSLVNEKGIKPTIIEINFVSSIIDILTGALDVIRKYKPKIIIRIGFSEDVLIQTYNFIEKVCPDYKIGYRYTVGIPQGLTMFLY